MNDQTEAEATEATEPTNGEPTPTDAEQPQPDTSREGNREAQRYRHRLRAAETELAVAQAVIAEFNREGAERVAGAKLTDPSDLWVTGIELDQLLDSSGKLDTELVEAAVTELLGRKPHLGHRGPMAPPASTVTGDGKAPQGGTAQSWAEALRGEAITAP